MQQILFNSYSNNNHSNNNHSNNSYWKQHTTPIKSNIYFNKFKHCFIA
jgi:hypothetical protein